MTDNDWAIAFYTLACYLRKAWDDMSAADTILAAFDKARGIKPVDYGLHANAPTINDIDYWLRYIQQHEASGGRVASV